MAKSLDQLINGLESIGDIFRDEFGRAYTKTRRAKAGTVKTPWLVVGEFSGFTVTYAELYKALRRVSLSKKISRQIGARTLARVRVVYNGPTKRSKRMSRTEREWTPGEMGPFEVVLSRVLALMDPDDEPSGSHRGSIGWTYGEGNPETKVPTTVREVSIWLSSEQASDTGEF